jgi:hypothetical protein
MNNADKTRQIIGLNKENDYILDPDQHMETYEKEAPFFASILRSSMISTILGEYNQADSRAIVAKNVFSKWSNSLIWATFITTVFTTGLLASSSFDLFFGVGSPVSKTLAVIFSLGGVAAAAVGTGCLQHIKNNKLLEKWMGTRAEAEKLRMQYFEELAIAVPKNGEDTLKLTDHLKLEFFRRFQLDVQLNYFSAKSIRHQKTASKLLLISTIAVMLVLFINGIAGIVGFIGETQITVIASFAIIAQAVSSMVMNKEAIGQDRQNSERYESARKSLNMLKRTIDQVHDKLDEGNPAILQNYIAAVHEPIMSEHRQWLSSQETRLSAISRLEEELKKNDKQQSPES